MPAQVGEKSRQLYQGLVDGLPEKGLRATFGSNRVTEMKKRIAAGWKPPEEEEEPEEAGESPTTETPVASSGNGSKPQSKPRSFPVPSTSTKDVNAGVVISGKGGQRREPFVFRWGQREYDLDPNILTACAIMYTLMTEQLGIVDSFSEVIGHSFAYVARTLGVQTAPIDNIIRQEVYNDGEGQEIERFIAEPELPETEGDGEGNLGNGQPINQEALAN